MAEEPTYKFLPEDKCLTEQQLFDYIDGKLNAAEMHLAEKHMLSCEMCSDSLEGLEKVKDRAKVAAFIPTTDGAKEKKQEETMVIPLHPNRKYFAIAAGIVLIVAISLYFRFSFSGNMEDAKMADNAPKKQIEQQVISPNESSGEKMDSANTGNTIGTTNSLKDFRAAQSDASTTMPVAAADESVAFSQNGISEDQKPDVAAPAVDAEQFNDRFSLNEKQLETNKEENLDLAKKANTKTVSDSDNDNKNHSASDDVVLVDTKDKQAASGATADSRTMPVPSQKATSTSTEVASSPPSGGYTQPQYNEQETVVMADSVSQTPTYFPLKPSDHDLDLSYTNGVKMLDSGKAVNAIVFFDEVLKYPKHHYYEDAQWKKSVALLQLNRTSEAKVLLQEIEKKGGKYKTQATAELKKL